MCAPNCCKLPPLAAMSMQSLNNPLIRINFNFNSYRHDIATMTTGATETINCQHLRALLEKKTPKCNADKCCKRPNASNNNNTNHIVK